MAGTPCWFRVRAAGTGGTPGSTRQGRRDPCCTAVPRVSAGYTSAEGNRIQQQSIEKTQQENKVLALIMDF